MDILAILPGAFGVFRMKTAAKIGLYNKDTLTEDFDLTLKLFKSDGNIEFVP
jgi:biofilm PGA synthesis N-glycosyltransferase PgaC